MRPDNKELKQALRKRFPSVLWSVTRGRGTGYGWTHIKWTDGPTEPCVVAALAELGAAPGSVDITDYFEGERVNTTRDHSDAFTLRVARELLDPKPVPPVETWSYDVQFPNRGGWRNLHQIVHRAAHNRENVERCRFEAHCWLAAWSTGGTEAPQVVRYA